MTRTSNRLALTVVILSSILLAMLLTGPHTPATVDAATTPTPDCTIGDTARHCVGNRLPAGKVIYAYQRCRGSKCGYPSMLPSVNRRNIDRLFDSEENFREMVTFALAENNAGWYSIMRPEYGTWNQGDVTANLFYQSNDPIANRYLGSEAPVLFTACDGSGCRVPRAVRGDLLVETDANRNAYIPRP